MSRCWNQGWEPLLLRRRERLGSNGAKLGIVHLLRGQGIRCISLKQMRCNVGSGRHCPANRRRCRRLLLRRYCIIRGVEKDVTLLLNADSLQPQQRSGACQHTQRGGEAEPRSAFPAAEQLLRRNAGESGEAAHGVTGGDSTQYRWASSTS